MPNPNFSGDYKDSFMAQFCDTRDVKKQEILLCVGYGFLHDDPEKCQTPSEYFADEFMKESFYNDADDYDKQLWKLIDDDEQPFTAICAYRGCGKTTILQAKMARSICIRQSRFIMYVAATQDLSTIQTENLKSELMGNQMIKDFFGHMQSNSYDGVSKSFSAKAWYVCEPADAKNHPNRPFCFVNPRSAQGQVRGRNIRLHDGRHRPDLILVDDFEDAEEVMNETNRYKNDVWYFGDLQRCTKQDERPNPKTNRWTKPAGALPSWRAPYRFFHIDTLKHHDALLAKLMRLSSWKHVNLPLGKEVEIIGPNGERRYEYKTCRPSRCSDEEFARDVENAIESGTLDVICRELMCQPAARQQATFHASMFQHYPRQDDEKLQNDTSLARAVIVDPSKSDNSLADYTGMLAIAIDPRMARINIRREVQERLTTNNVMVRAFELAVETNSRYVCVEKFGMEKHLQVKWQNAASTMDIQVRLIWLDMGHITAGEYSDIKVYRAEQVAPNYERLEVWHHMDMLNGKLENRLLEFPRMKDSGLTDCAGYIPGVMRELNIRLDKQDKKYENVERFKPRTDNDKIKARILAGEWAV